MGQKRQTVYGIFIDQSQEYLNDTASTLITVEEAILIMKEEHKTEINILIGRSEYMKTII